MNFINTDSVEMRKQAYKQVANPLYLQMLCNQMKEHAVEGHIYQIKYKILEDIDK
jgi:hypothetical protein